VQLDTTAELRLPPLDDPNAAPPDAAQPNGGEGDTGTV
jgi:hypothetical protein